MPTAGLLALLDDITSLLDDVAMMTKVASKKTAAVIGDDLALNANQLTGSSAARELPVVAAVAKGSLLNKLILIPSALLITAFVPALIKPLLMIGGAFLCFEGAEKVIHKFFHAKEDIPLDDTSPDGTPEELERARVKGAIRTDFILSAEILVIALGAAAGATVLVQALTLSAIGLGMTVLVYGSVALIVKADDLGFFLQRSRGNSSITRLKRALGRGIILGAPKLMKLLSVLGTIAMFLVGGEIIAHGIPSIEHTLLRASELASSHAPLGSKVIEGALNLIGVVALGFGIGLALLLLVDIGNRLRSRCTSRNPRS